MTPIIPHFSNECLDVLDMQDSTWPKYDETILKENIINIVVQINGKKRGLVKAELNITEEKLFEIIKNDETLTKYLNQKEFKKRIYIKNKLMNIII
jgi:leucyl-tRNA synthetase